MGWFKETKQTASDAASSAVAGKINKGKQSLFDLFNLKKLARNKYDKTLKRFRKGECAGCRKPFPAKYSGEYGFHDRCRQQAIAAVASFSEVKDMDDQRFYPCGKNRLTLTEWQHDSYGCCS